MLGHLCFVGPNEKVCVYACSILLHTGHIFREQKISIDQKNTALMKITVNFLPVFYVAAQISFRICYYHNK